MIDQDLGAQIWRELQRAVHDKNHEWRTPVLATTAPTGQAHARTVVLRQADPITCALQVFSDSRSPKVVELRHQALAQLVFWSRRLSWQLRVTATAAVDTDSDAVQAAWQRISTSPAAADYLSDTAPGDILWGDLQPDDDRSGRQGTAAAGLAKKLTDHHLCIIRFQVQGMDWLELARNGHQRARWDGHQWTPLVP